MVDIHPQSITESCRQGLEFLGRHDFIKNYYLAGGTALALQIGHRISTDLDWFSTSQRLFAPERELIFQTLVTSGECELISEQDGMLYLRLFGADVSFLHQHHSLLEPTVLYQSVQLASPIDIGLMKLAAINSRGTRRDFIDLFCLREIITLDQLLNLAPKKFRDRPSFLAITARALAYFDDAEHQPMPKMLTPVRWEDVRAYCEASARKLARRLSGLSDL